MNQKDLTEIVRHADPTISADRRSAIIGAIFDGIAESLARGEDVAIAGFGVFSAVHRSATKGRNPATGEDIDIAAKVVPKFKPYTALKAALNPPPAPKVGGARQQRERARA